MKKTITCQAGAMLAIVLFFTACKKDAHPDCQCMGSDSTVSKVTVFATGLNNPRGLKFGYGRAFMRWRYQ